MMIADLTDRLAQLRQLAEQITADAEVAASQQHEPHAAETLRAVSKGSLVLSDRVRAMQWALERL